MERNNSKRCHLCNVEISKSNWSKHIKTKKHLDNIRRNESPGDEKHCRICNVLIREDEWNNHIKSRFHKKNRKLFRKNLKKKAKPIINRLRRNIRVEEKHCRICNVLIREDEWNDHLKSITHKNKTKLLQNKLKEKVKSFNIRKQRLRHFNDLDFETDDYIVKKSEEALEGCFLTLRITPKNDISSVNVLIEE